MMCLTFEATNSLKEEDYDYWKTISRVQQKACNLDICIIQAIICQGTGVSTGSTTL